ncbi:amino acid ABC transporter permease [Marinithermus hydrothermalis]|uniref:Polar amino acid ABC transporter, inner membrane subunit n=1 Tax=Marinithermus hydrothermalis (strain DSM 14884 / JCM 11576 / T1) TaxID=869210 RepID=F2NPC4_MARHT|nr:amino acid ABC transporter permease [Marinithermus hydrothermalis]AEB12205.1 polar amino acid ABC transporter, inner membrane subunit [Marinithermus hydrothermalis DSM 14884]
MRAWAWMRTNLFNGWWNTLLTLLTGAGIFLLGKAVLLWALSEARWAVIPNNFRLFMVGPFPPEAVWRVWLVVLETTVLGGLSYGVLAQGLPRAWRAFWGGALLLAVLLWPLVFPATWAWAVATAAALPGAIWAGARLRGLRPYLPLLWLLGLFAAGALLSGVNTNLWGGLLLTLLITLLTVVLSFPLGLLLALGRTSRLPAIRILATLYIETVRGVPLVSVLFLAWIMVPLFVPEAWRPPQLVRVIAGFTLFAAAYLAEYIRGGLQGVPKGQYEAAWALGLNGFQTAYYIILPQAIRSVIPALIGQVIAIFKDTSLVAIVGLLDLLGIAQSVLANPNYLGLEREVYLFLLVVYFIGAGLMSYASRQLERAMGLGTR